MKAYPKPLEWRGDHDAIELIGEHDRREFVALHAHKEPPAEEKEKENTQAIYDAKQVVNGWVNDAGTTNRIAAEHMETARTFRMWKDARGYYARRAEIIEATARSLFDLRDHCRAQANEALKALCELQGTPFTPMNWD